MPDKNIYADGFNSVNTYIFGWIMSDGCLMREGRNKTAYAIRITSNDYDIIKWMHDTMCEDNKIYKCGIGYQIKYRNQSAIDYLMIHELTERKSLTLKYPNIPLEFMPDFVRGIFDGNGSIILRETKHNIYSQVSITSGSLAFLKGLQQYLSYSNICSHIYSDGRANKNAHYLRITKRSELEKFYKLIYQNKNCIKLNKKYDKYIRAMGAKPKYNIA